MVVDRTNGAVDLSAPTHGLIAMLVETFEATALPADLQKIPAVKPGSK
jgi:hypothetical protein